MTSDFLSCRYAMKTFLQLLLCFFWRTTIKSLSRPDPMMPGLCWPLMVRCGACCSPPLSGAHRVVEENFSAVLRRVESEWIGSDWAPFLHSAGCQLIQSPHSLRYVHADNTSEQRLWLLSVVMRQQLCLYWYIPKQDKKKKKQRESVLVTQIRIKNPFCSIIIWFSHIRIMILCKWIHAG